MGDDFKHQFDVGDCVVKKDLSMRGGFIGIIRSVNDSGHYGMDIFHIKTRHKSFAEISIYGVDFAYRHATEEEQGMVGLLYG